MSYRRREKWLVACLLLSAWTAPSAAEIHRVEPPHWWLGFENPELQLLVYGPEMGATDVRVEYPGVTVNRIERADSPNYLFVYLDIEESAQAGGFPIRFKTESRLVSYTFELRPRRSRNDRPKGFDSSDVVYLVTPDRFANGDPENDLVAGLGDPPDRGEPFGRHGGDIEGIRQHLDYIADMGFTSIWLNPVLENRRPRHSYHGYATSDYYNVDPRFGSNDSYRTFVADARRKGIGVIMDVITNHIGSGHWWMDDLPTRDWLNLPDELVYQSHPRTTNQDPYASGYDKRRFSNGWFSKAMPDLNQRNPLLADYLVQNSIWWIEYLGLHGLRLDTLPYPDKQFSSEWGRRILREYPEISIVGEEWSNNPVITSYWQRGKQNHDGYVSHLTHVMDFPIRDALLQSLTREAPSRGSAWSPVYEMLGNDFLYPEPQSLMIFPDNHDMSRIFTALDEDIALFRMALVYYVTMRGIPQIYYGTEILMSNPGTESHGIIRSDFPGGWDGDTVNAFTGKSLTPQQREAQDLTRKLLNWRRQNPVIHGGKLMQFAPVEDVYVYFRYNDEKTVMVLFNRGDGIDVDPGIFEERLGGASQGIDVINGKRYNMRESIPVEQRSVLLLEIQ